MKYLILDNIEAFNICNAIGEGFHGYPNEVGTQRYAEPIHHPDGVKVALPLFEVDDTELLWNKYREVFEKEPIILERLPEDWLQAPVIQIDASVSVELQNVTKTSKSNLK